MKTFKILTLLLLLGILSSCETASERDIILLQTYNYQSSAQEQMIDVYLEDALVPAIHKAGFGPVGVFKPRDPAGGTSGYTMLLIPFPSVKAFESLQSTLDNDDDYQEAAEDYLLAAHDNPPYDRMESILMKAFSATPDLVAPDLDSPRKDRVYELRSYQASTEHLYRRKVEMFDQGESALFIDLGFQPVFFGEVLLSDQMPHLIYMTVHADTTAQKANWDAFRVHPDWLEMKELERYKNTVSHIDKYLLYPVSYSDY